MLASEDNFGLGVTSSAWLPSQPALHLRDLPAAKPTTAEFGLSPELGVAAASVHSGVLSSHWLQSGSPRLWLSCVLLQKGLRP